MFWVLLCLAAAAVLTASATTTFVAMAIARAEATTRCVVGWRSSSSSSWVEVDCVDARDEGDEVVEEEEEEEEGDEEDCDCEAVGPPLSASSPSSSDSMPSLRAASTLSLLPGFRRTASKKTKRPQNFRAT